MNLFINSIKVCGALMRPLELSVNLEEKEEDNEDKFVLNLPDGTSHKQVGLRARDLGDRKHGCHGARQLGNLIAM